MNAIFTRTSVRKFEDRPVEKEKIKKLLQAGFVAPSAGNQQPWEFYIARDETTRLALAASSPYGTPAKLAPCVIVACQRTEGQQGIWHFNARQTCGAQALLGNGCDSPGSARLRKKIMGIKTLALQGHKQVPCLQCARVRVHAREHQLSISDQSGFGDMRLDQLQRFLQGHHDRFFPSRAASALCASAMSENG